ncbi:dnaJ homolog subfamily C member 16-like isoform X2 [Actinia tenebrosa]|uniref:DnaJ homolog subfamily C member 16 n=1 Tax=Actinia tenebrosa TaxID=6105 RepID=A0A6P8HP30_ACTTE|nr:dnaJ homolog subfamily C member 16-like isoform X2 [Actinia tenebrosa]
MSQKTTVVLVVLILGLVYSSLSSNSKEDPYEILGVSRFSSQQQIKKAYKKLARNWHPDKNDNPEAQEKFIKINEAYEILSNPEKRKEYDDYGHFGPNAQQYTRREPFFDTHGGFSFFFNDGPSSHTRNDFISNQVYQSHILPNSYQKPYVIEIISNWCLPCMQIEDTWDRASNDLKNLGVGSGVININRNPRLVDHLGVDHVPQIIGVINGQVYFFKKRISVRELKEFVVELFPLDLIQRVTTKNLDSFLNVDDNRPKVLLFSPKAVPSLLYHVVGFANQKRLSFGFVSTSNTDGEKLRRKFKALPNEPSVMIFKEEKSVPEVVVEGSELKSGKLREIVESNKYLILPRLSSQNVFQDLCPEERFRSQRKLCVILFTKKGKNEEEKMKLRTLAKEIPFPSERVHFVYMYEDIQTLVVEAMKDGAAAINTNNGTVLKLAILWNAGNNEIRYTWLPGGWHVTKEPTIDPAVQLKDMLHSIISGSGKMRFKSRVPAFYDEEIPGPLFRIMNKVKNFSKYVLGLATRKENMSIITMIVALFFIGAVGIFLPQGSDLDKRNPKSTNKQKTKSQGPALGYVQLNRSTEKELLKNAPHGQLTVTLLLDSVTPEETASSPLMHAYNDVISCYKRYQNARLFFRFAWLSIPENLQWCTEVMGVDKFGQINPGTVLVLNGYRKTVSVFKPTDLAKNEYFNNLEGDMMGFEDSDESETETQSDSLQGYERMRRKALSLSLRRELPSWIEKLTEGLIKKQKLDEWPVMDE